MSDQAKPTPRSQEMFWKLGEELATLEAQLASYQEKLDPMAATHPVPAPDGHAGPWLLHSDHPRGRGQRCQRVQERPQCAAWLGCAAPAYHGRERSACSAQQAR